MSAIQESPPLASIPNWLKRVQYGIYFGVRATAFLVAGMIIASTAIAQDVEDPGSASQEKPNIVFIFTDDLGYGDVGAYGATDIKTPNINRIAEQGILFTNSYSVSPVCTPSRAGLLTGRYPIRMGIHHVFFPGSFEGMPDSEVTTGRRYRANGISGTEKNIFP